MQIIRKQVADQLGHFLPHAYRVGVKFLPAEHSVAKSRPKCDKKREHRIVMEIVVDAYDEIERALGWYYYLDNQLQFPFEAICITKRAISPLKAKDKVEVLGMPSEEECEHEMFVTIAWDDRDLAVPLSQLKPSRGTDEDTKQAVADWHYWVKMGYRF